MMEKHKNLFILFVLDDKKANMAEIVFCRVSGMQFLIFQQKMSIHMKSTIIIFDLTKSFML